MILMKGVFDMKIKKFLMFLTCILAVVISFFTYKYQNLSYYYRYSSYNDYITSIEEKEVVPIWIELIDQDKNAVTDLLIKLTEFSLENNTDYVIVKNVHEDFTTNIDKFYLYAHHENLYNDFKKRGVSELDFTSIQPQGYYTTDTSDKDATGIIHILDNQIFNQHESHSQFLPVLQSVDEIYQQQNFYVYFYSDNAAAFTLKIDDWLKNNYSGKLQYINDIDHYHGAELNSFSEESMMKLNNILICIGLAYVVYYIIYFMKQRKKFMIQRMYGKSILTIFLKECTQTFILTLLLFNLCLYISNYMISHYQTFQDTELRYMLYTMSLSMVIGLCVVGILLYLFMMKSTSLKELKSGTSYKKNLFITMALKVIVITFMSTPFITSFSSFITSSKEGYFLNKNYDLVAKNYYLDGPVDETENNQKVMEYYLNNEGMYCDFMTGYSQQYEFLKETFPEVDQEQLKESSVNYPVIYANQNYILHQNKIYDTQNQEVDLNQYSTDVLLVPSKYMAEELEKSMLSSQVSIVEIKNPGTFINFFGIEPFIITNPVIYLCKNYNINLNMNMLYIPKSISLQNINENIKKLTGENPVLVDLEKRIESNFTDIQNQILEFGTIVILYMILFVGIIYQTAFLFIEQYKKILSILYVFGKNRYERYSFLMIMSLIFYCIPIIIQLLMHQITFLSILCFNIVCIVFECICILVFVRYLEKNSVSVILKGEEKL